MGLRPTQKNENPWVFDGAAMGLDALFIGHIVTHPPASVKAHQHSGDFPLPCSTIPRTAAVSKSWWPDGGVLL